MIRKFARRLLIFIYICVAFAFLIGCLSPFFNPLRWWVFGFISLLFPYTLIVLAVFFVFWLFAKPKWSLLAVACFIIGWKSILAVFAFHPGRSFEKDKKENNALRVMTWNVRSFTKPEEIYRKPGLTTHQMKMFDLIKDYDPDVIAMQEFYTVDSGKYFNSIWYFTKTIGYPYYYFSKDKNRYRHHYSGTVIFSKYPIIDTAKFSLSLAKDDVTESLISTDIIVGEDTIRVYTGHLQSFGFRQREYDDISKIKNDPAERVDASKNIFRKMRYAFERRGEQADFIHSKLDSSPYPEIFCGDLNDVPNSYTYFTVREDKRDAFVASNFGFGQTYYSFSSGFMRELPTLRIDYIFADRRFNILQCDRIPKVFSDHFPVIADVILKR
ncbi:MAG: endonuclease/exonuclease/phosphatase family protein [Agriterribacter sp.]